MAFAIVDDDWMGAPWKSALVARKKIKPSDCLSRRRHSLYIVSLVSHTPSQPPNFVLDGFRLLPMGRRLGGTDCLSVGPSWRCRSLTLHTPHTLEKQRSRLGGESGWLFEQFQCSVHGRSADAAIRSIRLNVREQRVHVKTMPREHFRRPGGAILGASPPCSVAQDSPGSIGRTPSNPEGRSPRKTTLQLGNSLCRGNCVMERSHVWTADGRRERAYDLVKGLAETR